ncbi:MAG: LTA synthase family protein [Flavobacteriales bacterium]
MFKLFFLERFKIIRSFFVFFILFSFLIRTILFFWSYDEISFSILNTTGVFILGLFFDIGSFSLLFLPLSFLLTFIPKQWNGSYIDKILIFLFSGISAILMHFSFVAELTFWDEYQKRFNFIAVDYLLYTYEVIESVQESYSLPLIISLILILTFLFFAFSSKLKSFSNTFSRTSSIKSRLPLFGLQMVIVFMFTIIIDNQDAEQFENQYEVELSKSGVYSFFSAYNANELNYIEFYKTLKQKDVFKSIKNILKEDHSIFVEGENPIKRTIANNNNNKEVRPNVMFVCIESMNANFMNHFGNKENLTPFLDQLANNSFSLTNLHATGTRTIRGLEAITMAIPPTPGRSIIKRENNKSLFNVSEIFNSKGYSSTFFYGGDSHFDNMLTYFGNNGFDVVDHKEEHRFEENIAGKRIQITDKESTFENAWGVCDEDLFNKVLNWTDEQELTGKPFFNFVMTSSNHPPFTYPANKIQKNENNSEREGAVKYTDYAIEQFMNKAKTKPWYKNTVFVFIADHNAYSAGRSELNVRKYHIPAFIYNLPNQQPKKSNKLCSQIDIFPTLFGFLDWKYEANWFGKDVRKMQTKDERTFISNHRKLGYRKNNDVVILDCNKDSRFFKWKREDNSLTKIPKDIDLETEAISHYQSAYFLYKNGLLNSSKPI